MTRVSLDAALDAVLARSAPLPAEDVPLAQAVGRVLAEDVRAREARPEAPESAMDGYAVRGADVASAPVTLTLIGESRAGTPMVGGVGAGQAARISTGAVLPEGADTVVQQEHTSAAEGASVTVDVAAASGMHVRRAGEDWASGDVLLGAGTQIRPDELATLAGAGAATVRCARRPRIAVLVTGDELLPVDAPLTPGAVRDTSTIALPAILAAVGAETVWTGIAPDSPAMTESAVHAALAAEPDLILATGGASVGPHDHVRPSFLAAGFATVFERVLLKPGGPTWCAQIEPGGPLVLGLPGNPVASVVVTHLLAVPAASRMLGAPDPVREITATLTGPAGGARPRMHAARCRVKAGERGWEATVLPKQGSHQLTSLLGVDGLALIPASEEQLGAGDQVRVRLL